MTQEKKTDDIRMNLASHDAVADRLEGLKSIFPEAFVEGKVDLERLRQHLGDFSHTGTERYGLTWAGKADAIRALQIPSHGTLVPMRKESVNFDESENMIIEGDNLEVLKLLQKSYHGKIKMIYIDPPYNTGGDFIYPDNFKEGLDTYLKYSGQATEEGFKATTNAESNGRYHSNWLNMMYPRLFMAKNLLRDDGVIFISIDDHEAGNLRLMMDEIFGAENFISQIVWEKMYTTKNDSSQISDCHEYIFCYSRNSELKPIGLLPRTEEMDARYKNPDNDPRGVWKAIPLYAKGESKSGRYKITSPTGKVFEPLPNNHWRYRKEDILEMIRDNRIHFGKDGDAQPNMKRFLTEVQQGAKSKTLWKYDEVGSNDSAKKELRDLYDSEVLPFDFPKPRNLIRRMLQMTTGNSSNEIILDFFSGSGTTAEAIMEQNSVDGGKRTYILVQLPEITTDGSNARNLGFNNISEITRDRVRRYNKRILSNADLVSNKLSERLMGYKSLKLSSSNFKLWDAANAPKDAEALAQTLELFADNVLPDRSQEDILFEVILKSGQPLTAKIEKIEVAGQKVFSINDGAMLVCLEDPLEEATLRGMLELTPAVMVALDKAFHGNDQLKTNIKLQAEATGESEQSRVLFKTV